VRASERERGVGRGGGGGGEGGGGRGGGGESKAELVRLDLSVEDIQKIQGLEACTDLRSLALNVNQVCVCVCVCVVRDMTQVCLRRDFFVLPLWLMVRELV